jgi:hypothetical protein
MGVSWRWRRCPKCQNVAPGGEYRPVSYGLNWQPSGVALRVCPQCGLRARTAAFPIVREARVTS